MVPMLQEDEGKFSEVILVFVIIFLLTLGEQLWKEYLPKYIIALGASIFVLGIFKAFTKLLEAISQYPSGVLSDKLGRYSSMLLFVSMGILGYVIYEFAPSWEWIFAGSVLVLGTSVYFQPTLFAYIGDKLPPKKRGKAFSIQSILKRIPIIVAPPLGGYLITTFGIVQGVKLGLSITIFLAVLSLIILIFMRPKKESRKTNLQEFEKQELSNNKMDQKRKNVHIPEKMRYLLISDILARFGRNIVEAYIIIYVIDILGYSPVFFGFMISLQMTIAILSYFPAGILADKVGRKIPIAITFACFAAFPLFLILPINIFAPLLSFGLAGFREFGEPARKAMIVDLTPPETKGQTIGSYYTARSLAVLPASIIGALIWEISPEIPFIIASVISAFGLIVFLLKVENQ